MAVTLILIFPKMGRSSGSTTLCGVQGWLWHPRTTLKMPRKHWRLELWVPKILLETYPLPHTHFLLLLSSFIWDRVSVIPDYLGTCPMDQPEASYSQRPSSLCLPSPGIKCIHYHNQPGNIFSKGNSLSCIIATGQWGTGPNLGHWKQKLQTG